MEDITCPFCAEVDFDLYGLHAHLNRGWCQAFNAINDDQRTGKWIWDADTEEWKSPNPIQKDGE